MSSWGSGGGDGRGEDTPPRGVLRPGLADLAATVGPPRGASPSSQPHLGALEGGGLETRSGEGPARGSGTLETLVGEGLARTGAPDARNLETRVSEGLARTGAPDARNLETRVSEGVGPTGGPSPGLSRGATRGDLLIRASTAGSVVRDADGELREIGRYLVISRLGAGGMGVVYRAYDPDLDRRVAIKVLRGQGSVDARTRLLREAQAMAKLSHPAVVPVFDVGPVGDQVFVAMDFIDGQDLAAWIAAGPHRWEEVVDVFVQAGAGLAAAHAVGLVHRDFKPDNVLLSRDPATGRLRAQVADFGLARLGDEAERAPAPVIDDRVARHSALSQNLTRMGSVMGTPAYMSPEQHAGLVVDARGDQFSFGVAFYEALYQRRPFDGDTMEALAEGARRARRGPPPPGSRAPAWLHRIVLRAMHPDREARYPTMEALLAAIEAGRGRGRRRWLVGGGVLAIASLGLGLALREPPPPLCAGGPAKVAGAWDHGRRSAAEAAFRATGKPYAADAWSRVEARVDAYASAWVDAYTEACEATRVRGELSSEVLDLRMICLEQRLQDLRVLTDMLQEADTEVVKRAVEAAAGLPELAACADVLALRAGPAPAPEAIAARAQGVQERLSEGRSLLRIRKDKEALALLGPLAGEAEALGHLPTHAEVLLALADAQADTGADEAALKTAQRALWAAIAGHHDAIVDDALRQIVLQIGHKLGRRDDAQPWIEHARAQVAREGDRPADLASHLSMVGTVEVVAGRYAEAEAAVVRAIELREASGADPLRLVDPLNALGVIYVRTGRYAQAQAPVERALAIVTDALGPAHPDLVFPLNTLALIHERLARYDAAIAALQRSLELMIAASGPEHPNVGLLRQNLGGMKLYAGDRVGARVELERALPILEAAVGAEHPALGSGLTLYGELELEDGDLAAARARYQRAIDLRTAALGADHPELGLSLVGLAQVELAEGHADAAIVHCERALAMLEGEDPGDLGIARFTLARALWGRDRAGARAAAEAALVKLREAGVTVDRHRLAAEAWLREHPAP